MAFFILCTQGNGKKSGKMLKSSYLCFIYVNCKFGFTKLAFLLMLGSHDILFVFYSIKGTKIN